MPDPNRCTVPPEGWFCTRDSGHDGPCAALPKAPETLIDLKEAAQRAEMKAEAERLWPSTHAQHGVLLDQIKELHAEVERLRTLIEPAEWTGWDQIDSIYEEARLLRRERDAERAEVVRLRTQWDALLSDEAAEAAVREVMGAYGSTFIGEFHAQTTADVVGRAITAAIEAAQTTTKEA